MKVLGIDPGTKSMDVCGLEDGKVFFEKVVETTEVAEDPTKLIEVVKSAGNVDLIAAPSGYGVEVTYLDRIPKDRLEDWYYNYILLTEKEYIEEARENDVFGAHLYHAMTESIKEMKDLDCSVCFIPGVINLDTVPVHRKINKVDMGTADKMCVTALGILNETQDKRYKDVNMLVLEMGFGYNSVIKVKGGKIVDGLGGTTMPGPGFLTASSLDFEVVQLGGTWSKQDVFQGGTSTIAGVQTPEELVDCIVGEGKENNNCEIAFEAMMDGVEKGVKSLGSAKDSKVVLSGRLNKIDRIRKNVFDRLSDYSIDGMQDLEGAKITKKTAQGYAVVADGLAGGAYSELIELMRLKEAKGSCIDYLYHPRLQDIKFSNFRF